MPENKFSQRNISNKDSEGNELTKEQQEYFKDSKVRDEDGNLLKVYHGTDAEFTVFDRTKGRSNEDIQGMFFSPWDIEAGGYGGNVKSYYLNITNPASESLGYKALKKFQGQNNVGIKAREYLISLGYDGVANYDEYIAFYPEQIKLVENKKPTGDPDIRFSQRNTYSYNELTSKPDMEITVVDMTKVLNRADTVVEAKKNAAKVGTRHKDGSISVKVKDTGKDVIIGTKGLAHGLDRRLKQLGPIAIEAGRIIQNSITINELVPKRDNVTSSYVLLGAAQDTENIYIVESVINTYSNELMTMDVLYSQNEKREPKKGTAALNAPQVSTPDYRTTISISELLDYVNKHFPDILSEDVLKHFGHSERPSGELGKSALFSARNTLSEAALLNDEMEAREKERMAADVKRLNSLNRFVQNAFRNGKIKESTLQSVASVIMESAGIHRGKAETQWRHT